MTARTIAGCSAITDGLGIYVLKQMRPGIYNLALDLRNEWGKDFTARAHQEVHVSSKQAMIGFDFELIPGAIIQGRVFDAVSGIVLEGIGVGVYGPAHPHSSAWVQVSKSGKDGVYSLRVPAGKQYVYMYGFPPPNLVRPRGREVTLKDGETLMLDFALPRK